MHISDDSGINRLYSLCEFNFLLLLRSVLLISTDGRLFASDWSRLCTASVAAEKLGHKPKKIDKRKAG